MFFEIHDEGRIGYKHLTDADLGRSPRSHQTHIGLFDDVLTYLPHNKEIDDALLIYENRCDTMTVKFDRILRENGDYNSPKISTGGTGVVSIVSTVREISKNNPDIKDWYLFWFGLKSEQPVFFLFNDQSDTFQQITSMGISLQPGVKNRITNTDTYFTPLMSYLERIVNDNGKEIIRDVETTVTLGFSPRARRYRPYDIKRAEKIFEKLGRSGEELIDSYLSTKMTNGEIENFTWFNRDGESGLPYDFSIQEAGDITYIDVKTTSSTFNQPIVFSLQELSFIANTPNKYCVYRIYNCNDAIKKLKICGNYQSYALKILESILQLDKNISPMGAKLQTLKIVSNLTYEDFILGEDIDLV